MPKFTPRFSTVTLPGMRVNLLRYPETDHPPFGKVSPVSRVKRPSVPVVALTGLKSEPLDVEPCGAGAGLGAAAAGAGASGVGAGEASGLLAAEAVEDGVLSFSGLAGVFASIDPVANSRHPTRA